MTIASASLLEVWVGDSETLYTISLYEKDGLRCATFTVEDPACGAWIPIPVPRVFLSNPDIFDDFKDTLAQNGYVFRNVASTELQ